MFVYSTENGVFYGLDIMGYPKKDNIKFLTLPGLFYLAHNFCLNSDIVKIVKHLNKHS